MITVHNLRGTMADTLQLLVQSEDELRKREALAGVSVDVHLRYDGGRREGWGQARRWTSEPLPNVDRIDISVTVRGIAAFADWHQEVSAESINFGLIMRFNLFDLLHGPGKFELLHPLVVIKRLTDCKRWNIYPEDGQQARHKPTLKRLSLRWKDENPPRIIPSRK